MWPNEWHHYQWPWRSLLLLKTFLTPIIQEMLHLFPTWVYTWIGNEIGNSNGKPTCLVISTVFLMLNDKQGHLQSCSLYIYWKWCKIEETWLLLTTCRKWYMVYLIAAVQMSLSGHTSASCNTLYPYWGPSKMTKTGACIFKGSMTLLCDAMSTERSKADQWDQRRLPRGM